MEGTSLQYNPQIIFRKIGTETVLVPIGENTESVRNIYSLNDSASFVLSHIREGKSLSEIYSLMEENYEIESIEEAKEWVNELITEFRSNNILL